MTEWIRPSLDLEFDEGEVVLFTAQRHWIALVQRGFVFVLIAGIATGLAFYRGIGGTFIEGDVVQDGIDFFNVVILLLIAALGLVFWQARRTARKNKKKIAWGINLLYALGFGVLALIFLFRYEGGRVFYIEPEGAVGFDLANGLLIALALLMAAAVVYVYVDWANDFLILTSNRVLHEDRQEIPFVGGLIGRPIVLSQFIQQMLIEDIQQVNVRQESYIEFWLYRLLGRFGFERYGTLVLRSISPQRLVFELAANPNIMQKHILDEVNKVRQREKPELLLRRMIEDEVYGNKRPKPTKRPLQIRVRQPKLLSWLFVPNPDIRNDGTIIWRPAWVYTTWLMTQPLVVWFLVTVVLAVLVNLGVLTTAQALLFWVPATLANAGWAWWIWDEHEHDLYILTTKDITDIDKRPFGPENRRQAALNAIQDISYNYGFFENLFRYGDVVIETAGAGGGKFTFRHVPSPRDVQATINDYLTDFRRNERESQLRNTVALIREYHTVQSSHGELLDREQLAQDIIARVNAETPYAAPIDQFSRELRREARTAARIELWQFLRRRGRRRSRGNQ